jgi:hypothetical protein
VSGPDVPIKFAAYTLTTPVVVVVPISTIIIASIDVVLVNVVRDIVFILFLRKVNSFIIKTLTASNS